MDTFSKEVNATVHAGLQRVQNAGVVIHWRRNESKCCAEKHAWLKMKTDSLCTRRGAEIGRSLDICKKMESALNHVLHDLSKKTYNKSLDGVSQTSVREVLSEVQLLVDRHGEEGQIVRMVCVRLCRAGAWISFAIKHDDRGEVFLQAEAQRVVTAVSGVFMGIF